MALPFQIMIITDEGADVLDRVEQALRVAPEVAAQVAVQLRLKTWPLAEVRALGEKLRVLTRSRGVALLINGRLDLALELGAEGLHLPAQSTSVADARASLPSKAFVGVSCHTQNDLARAGTDGASYALLSPIHAVPGKAPPLGITEFGVMALAAALPVFALGGIALDDVSPLRQAGAAGIAVMRAVLSSSDPARALTSLCEHWDDHPA